MKPILSNGIDSFVREADLELAEAAMRSNLKLIESVSATYPDDRDFLLMAAMVRANYAFGFLLDELEALRIAEPSERARAKYLATSIVACYEAARDFAERALAANDAWSAIVAGRRLEELELPDFDRAVATLETQDAEPLFWLGFAWGGSMMIELDAAQATQLPKLERIADRVVILDESIFFGVGPRLLAGMLRGFRSPAIGGDPDAARNHFRRAEELGRVLLPAVFEAQFVDAQTENLDAFETTLLRVLAAPIRKERALFDVLAKKKACRLLANIDQLFLAEAKPAPDLCDALPRKYPLRETPLPRPSAVSIRDVSP